LKKCQKTAGRIGDFYDSHCRPSWYAVLLAVITRRVVASPHSTRACAVVSHITMFFIQLALVVLHPLITSSDRTVRACPPSDHGLSSPTSVARPG